MDPEWQRSTQHHGQAEADNYAPYVIDEGVKPADLTRENKSLDTYQNARNVALLSDLQ